MEQLGKDMYTFSRLFIQDVFHIGNLAEAYTCMYSGREGAK